MFYHTTYGALTYLSLIPVVVGAALATFGEYSATSAGMLLTLCGALLAAIKTIVTNRVQTHGLRLGSLELLYRVAPLAAVQSVLCAWFVEEIDALMEDIRTNKGRLLRLMILFGINACIAFALNVVSFKANRRLGALTMSVAGNVKQTLAVWLSVLVFGVDIGLAQFCGMLAAPFSSIGSSCLRMNKASC